MSPALNGSSAIRHFKHSNAIETCDGITFDFYRGLPCIVGLWFHIVKVLKPCNYWITNWSVSLLNKHCV